MRTVLGMAVGVAIGAAGCCAGWPQQADDEPPPPGARESGDSDPWERTESVDDLTRRPVSTMEVLGFSGEDRAHLTVREHPRHGTDVYVTVERGRVRCYSHDCRVEVVFDDSAPVRWVGVPEDSGDGSTVFLRRADSFLQRLRRSQVVRVEITVAGRGSMTFLFPGLLSAED